MYVYISNFYTIMTALIAERFPPTPVPTEKDSKLE